LKNLNAKAEKLNLEDDRKIEENEGCNVLLNGTPRRECLLHEKINFAALLTLIVFFLQLLIN
jgi:hypothetical protein